MRYRIAHVTAVTMVFSRFFGVLTALAALTIALLLPVYQYSSTNTVSGHSKSMRMDPWHSKPNPNATMRAVVYDRHAESGSSGTDSSLRLVADAPRPLVRPRQVLIQVMAASINPVDFKYLRGAAPPLLIPKPKIPGHDVAGLIVEVGERANSASSSTNSSQQHSSVTWKLGDRVAAMVPSLLSPWGTLAEYVAVDASLLARIPNELFLLVEEGDDSSSNIITSGSGNDDHQAWIAAASLPLVGLTVVQAFGRLGPNYNWEDKKVLIQAGGGGVGTFAVQYAKNVLHASHVVTTASSVGKAELLRQLGADRVIDYRATPFEDMIQDYDVVLDPVSWSYEKRTLQSKVLKPSGWYLNIISSDWSLRNGKELANGASSLWNVFANFVRNWIRPGSTPRVAIVGVASNGPQLQSVLDWVGKRTIRPVVDRVFPLDDAHAAFRYLEQGRATGKVVIKVDHMDKKAEG